ncbi:MAG: hypothetical protein CVU99_00400 [Firmicutes bacterium HGW-Firmicutes-4]|jgi:hypothetical protein|nr:MAG: hypothetical protein CVU99_00400 [Firmicutes bacterium HGW-Firmicutes-4]
MKVSALVGDRFKETPSECVIDSHIFMLRGGYIRGSLNNHLKTNKKLIYSPFRAQDEYTNLF